MTNEHTSLEKYTSKSNRPIVQHIACQIILNIIDTEAGTLLLAELKAINKVNV